MAPVSTKKKKKIRSRVAAVVVLCLVVAAVWVVSKQLPLSDVTSPQSDPSPLAASEFSPEDFVLDENGYMTCLSQTCIRGIDVSTHQKEIDWVQVKNAGFEFVMIRLGYRGSVQGLLFEDEWAQSHYQGAKAAGLKVGGYFFSQAVTVEEAKEEARYAMQIIQDWELDMPLVYDWELIQEDYRNADLDARTLTDCVKAFCDTVEQAGYTSMVYFNPDVSSTRIYLEELSDYDFWLAMYHDEMVYPYKVDMWQYTCTGSVPGIQGNVDIDLYFPYDENT